MPVRFAPTSPQNCYPARMDIGKILTEMRQEHAQLTEAIIAIELMAAGQGKRRGRPPGSKNAGKAQT